jgi:hypothetical protein
MPKVIIAISRPDDMPWELVLNMNQLRRFQELQQVVGETDWEQKPTDNPDQPSTPAEPQRPDGWDEDTSVGNLFDIVDKATRRQQDE